MDDRGHALSRCQGYGVFDLGGRIGVVEALEYGSREDLPDRLVVRRGIVRRRRMRVPVEQVVDVDARKRRVVIHGAPVRRVRWRSPAEEIRGGAEVVMKRVRGPQPPRP